MKNLDFSTFPPWFINTRHRNTIIPRAPILWLHRGIRPSAFVAFRVLNSLRRAHRPRESCSRPSSAFPALGLPRGSRRTWNVVIELGALTWPGRRSCLAPLRATFFGPGWDLHDMSRDWVVSRTLVYKQQLTRDWNAPSRSTKGSPWRARLWLCLATLFAFASIESVSSHISHPLSTAIAP